MRPTSVLLCFFVLVAPAAAFRPTVLRAPKGRAVCPLPQNHALPSVPRALQPLAVASLPPEEKQLDATALGRYVFALLSQMVFITTFFGFIDLFCYGPLPGQSQLGGPLPWQAVVGIFFAMSLRSRIFSGLDNSRPDQRRSTSAEEDEALRARLDSKKAKKNELRDACEKRGLAVDGTMESRELSARLEEYLENASESRGVVGTERIMPSWTPPGATFPIMWVGVVAPLRAFSSSLVYETSTGRLNEGHLNDPVLLWLIFHLCIGDIWNTINNVEGRTGAAVPGVLFVWLSTIFAAKQYYDIAPQAGLLLGD